MIVRFHHDHPTAEKGPRAARSITATDQHCPPSTSEAMATSGELRSRLLQLIVENEQSRKSQSAS